MNTTAVIFPITIEDTSNFLVFPTQSLANTLYSRELFWTEYEKEKNIGSVLTSD